MQRYMNGVLLSNIFWQNHAETVRYFRESYLPRLSSNMEHLEIGPGHGMFLYFAAEHGLSGRITGWDVSETSIAHTRLALKAMGLEGAVRLEVGNLFDTDLERLPRYDSIVLGEVLEHLEDPVSALTSVKQLLKPGGLTFINVPANSPAPDHIYLIEDPQHALDLVTSANLELVDWAFFPMTGATLERAINKKLSVSCVMIARRPL
jgi:2-polyprenyl-3-methyl-5-hydroxy-6-metoxy-1,4-benzoquinol methylase